MEEGRGQQNGERGGEKKQTGGGQNSDKGWVPLLFSPAGVATRRRQTHSQTEIGFRPRPSPSSVFMGSRQARGWRGRGREREKGNFRVTECLVIWATVCGAARSEKVG